MYTLAFTLCGIFWMAATQISDQVLYPAYAEILRTNPSSFYQKLFKARLIMVTSGWLFGLFFVFFGNELMGVLYDSRYAQSGSMLEILALGSLAGIVGGSYSVALFAMGELKLNTFLIFSQVFLQITTIYFGYNYYGSMGVIYGIALSNWLHYCFQAAVYASKGLWQYKLDLPFLLISALVVIYYVRHNA
jgi:O-antigen/teichoic acid export membrane protein